MNLHIYFTHFKLWEEEILRVSENGYVNGQTVRYLMQPYQLHLQFRTELYEMITFLMSLNGLGRKVWHILRYYIRIYLEGTEGNHTKLELRGSLPFRKAVIFELLFGLHENCRKILCKDVIWEN